MEHVSKPLRIFLALLAGVLIFLAGWFTSIIIPASFKFSLSYQPWFIPALKDSVIVVLSLLLIIIAGRKHLNLYGICKPKHINYLALILWGIIIGGIFGASLFILHGKNLLFIDLYDTWEKIIFAVILSSFSEEFLTRGVVQSIMMPGHKKVFTILKSGISFPIIITSLFYAFLYLPLILKYMELHVTIIILIIQFVSGIIAGQYREKSGSMLPSIIFHIIISSIVLIVGLIFFKF